MSKKELPPEFLKLLKSVTAKRAKTVIDHILKHGQITTEELKVQYGYNHPPRAARDVREQGIPIKTIRVTGSDGRQIGAYTFGDPSEVRATQLSGRTAFSTGLKQALIARDGPNCNIYLKPFPERELQIDHRIPFEIAGDGEKLSVDIKDYMLLSASANRAKSWSCEHCPNWTSKDTESCKTCYWAFPESYKHIAMRKIRRLDILWTEEEVEEYDRLIYIAGEVKETPAEYTKQIIREKIK